MGNDIQSAATYINNTLVSRGYLKDSQRLEFPSLQRQGQNDQSDQPLAPDPHVIKNDSRVINVIYGLLDALDEDTRATGSQERKIKDLSKELERVKTNFEREAEKNKTLQLKLQRMEQQHSQIEAAFRSQELTKHEAQDSFVRLQSLVGTLKQQFANELRRRDVEIAKLKDRLRDSTRVRVYTGVSGTLSKSMNSYGNQPASGGHGHIASRDHLHHQKLIPGDDINTDKLSQESQESQDFSNDLVDLNNRLVEENTLLLKLLYDVKAAVASLTNDQTSAPLEFEFSEKLDSAGVAVRITDADTLGKNIAMCLDQIYSIMHSPNFVSVSQVKEKDEEIALLQQQLEETKANWQAALQMIDEWKTYAEKRNSGSASFNSHGAKANAKAEKGTK